VVFSWIVFASREDRDRINAKVMSDPRMTGMDPKSMPFDAKRMIYGGFRSIVEVLASDQAPMSTIISQESQRPNARL
jgi:hypothetical protein